MSSYHCPQCGKDISFGEAICPNCKADVTSVWEQASGPKKEAPKIIPGTGGMQKSTPFPPPSGSTPFPAPASASSPFPPPASASNPFPPPSSASNPFPPPAGGASAPFPPQGNAPFPPQAAEAVAPISTKAVLDIQRIGGIVPIPDDKEEFHIGRDEIQGVATKALPDLNAYNNISKVRKDGQGNYTKEQFIIYNKNGEYKIEDKRSTNGTYLGTTKLQGMPPQPLKDGDKIIIPVEEAGKLVQLEVIFKINK